MLAASAQLMPGENAPAAAPGPLFRAPAFLQLGPGILLPPLSQIDAARSDVKKWHTGPGVHGIAPNCDWGFTGADCMTPICGVEKFHQPKFPYYETQCAPQPTELSPNGLHVRVLRTLYHLGLYPLPRLPNFLGVVLFLVLLHTIRANAQFLLATTLLFLWRMMS